MKKLINFVWVFAIVGVGSCVHADTEQVNSTAYQVQISDGDPFEMPNGSKGVYGLTTHATLVQNDGQTASQWCTGEMGLGDNGEPTGVGGYCTIIQDNGDVLWVSYLGTPETGTAWTVMGGTGQYEGATGGGTSTMVSQRADGQAWTSQSTGTITTP